MDCMKVGKLILQLRTEKGLTQKQVADQLNISNKTISKWECGLGCPDVSLWEELANVLQVCLDSGAKKVLLPITSAGDIGTVPSDLVGAFSLIFYSTPQEAVFKALGVE